MVLFNYSTRELTAKIVYYGPGLCGKTTNLQFIHENLPGEVKGKMLSLATKTDRTLFFDFLPIDLGEIRGMKTRVQLYTVPGQVFYNETRKLVLKGADGIVFVADSQETMLGANIESFKNLEENLKAHGMKLAEMPHVIQFNKRDLPKLASIEDLNAAVNKYNGPFYESVATTGIGVQDTLKAIVKLVLLHLTKKYDPKSIPASERTVPLATPVAVVEAPKPQAKAKAKAAPAPEPLRARPVAEALPAFAEQEIDDLVGDVAEIEAPAPAPAMTPVPAAAIPVGVPVSAAAEDDGAIWLGSPDGDETTSIGSHVSLDDLLASETDPGTTARAPEPAEPEPEAWTPQARFGSDFEIDRGFDPEWATPMPDEPPAPAPAPMPRAEAPRPPMPEPAPAAAPAPVPMAAAPVVEPVQEEVLLTEVAGDDELFDDPSLDVARLSPGEQREILVPVQLGEGAQARRFKLSIRLKFDPID
jgi:signal recognition particle receptor subunit beta